MEEIINLSKEEIENNDENITAILDLEDLKSLENLLTRYKQLEEENKIYKEELKKIDKALNLEEGTLAPNRNVIIESLNGGISLLNKIIDDSIPKSKVKEKIEELENKIRPKQEIHQKLCKEIDKTGTETEYDYAMEELSILDDELREMLIEKRVLQDLLREE